MGFQRCCYEKLDHIHCMAFRKTLERSDYDSLSDMSAHMYIPQDFNTPLSEGASQDPNIQPSEVGTQNTPPSDASDTDGESRAKKQKLDGKGDGGG